ncbi:MAG: autoinducer binding domain-containing protein, partial [Parvularcula sp.]|nr:autoinducer binding domain-containing protein [Parvularcula sp.]
MLSQQLQVGLEAIAAAGNASSLQDALGQALATFDIHTYTAAIIEQNADRPAGLEVTWMGNVAQDWLDYYVASDSCRRDFGMRKHAIDRDPRNLFVGDPFAQRYGEMRDDEKAFYRESVDANLVSGLTVPRWLQAGGEEVATGFCLWSGLQGEAFERLIA